MNETRKLILKVLLICLAIAAVTGVLAVLSSSSIISRVTWTAFFASFCALLLLGVSRLDKPATFAAGLVGMVVVTLEFLLGMALIWFTDLLGGYHTEESLFITGAVLLLWGFAAMVYTRMVASPFSRIAGYAGLVTAGIAFVACVAATWMPGAYWDHDRLWGTAWTVGFLGVLAAILLIGLGVPVLAWSGAKTDPQRGGQRHWRWIGIAATTVAAGMALYHIWIGGNTGPEAFAIILTVGAWLGLANLITLTPLKPEHRWLGLGTLATAAVTGGLCILVALGWDDEFMARLISAAAIPTACGCMACIVMARLTRRTEFASAASKEIRINLTCPRCRRRQDLPLGGAPCEACGLKIEVKVEEPRCTQCGYMLYMLTGDKCPECGAAIDAKAHQTAT